MKSYSQLKDLELFKMMLKNSDHTAFEEIRKRYQHSIETIAIRIARANYSHVEDLIQESFMGLLEYKQDPDLVRDFKNLFFTIARNKMSDYLKTFEREWSGIDLAAYEAKSNLNTDSTVLFKEFERIVENIKAELPEARKQIYVMSREEEKKNGQIAEELNISPETVKSQIHKALKPFHDQLEPWRKKAKRISKGIKLLMILFLLQFLAFLLKS